MKPRKQRKYPRIRASDWGTVDRIVQRLRGAAGKTAAAVLLSRPGTPEAPSVIHHLVVTAINTIRLDGVEELSEIGGATPYIGVTKLRTRTKMVRFFFRTSKGCDPIPPVETFIRTAQVWSKLRGKAPPFHDMGEGWARFRDPEILCADGEWRHSSHVPQRPVTCNGVPNGKVVWGERLDGHTVTEVACDERCVFATGHKCECTCGGVNHGSAMVAERFVPRSPAEQVKLLVLYGSAA